MLDVMRVRSGFYLEMFLYLSEFYFRIFGFCDLVRFSSYACYKSPDVLEDLSLTKVGKTLLSPLMKN